LREDITERKHQETQREALQEVRDEIWKMQSTPDLERVLRAVKNALHRTEVPFMYCSINLVDDHVEPLTITVHSLNREGRWNNRVFQVPDPPPLFHIWQEQELSYRPDLQSDDPYGEHPTLTTPLRSVLDVPFSKGTLAVSSTDPHAFSAADLQNLQALTGLLAEGFQRLDDIQEVEQRNQDLEEEIAERKQAEEDLIPPYKPRYRSVGAIPR
jgi:transcriptional regulator with GAF, ATPase, and Fis domain